MRIGIDARIGSYNSSGLARYLFGLIGALSKRDSEDSFVLLKGWRRQKEFRTPQSFQQHTVVTPPHNRFEDLFLPLELSVRKLDLVHSIDFYTPVPSSLPLICTAQDLYFLREPRSMSAESFRHYKKFERWALRAAHIVCSSESTRRDLLEFTSVPEEQASVIYPGWSEQLLYSPVKTQRRKQILEELSLDEPPLLFVGTLEPRKNVERLILAYRLLREQKLPRLPELLIVGKEGYQGSLQRRKFLSEKGVRFLGGVSESRLQELYATASLLVYPSLYEGFGFPILEAFATDTAVVTSRGSSTEEVAGDAAVLVDPLETESIADGIRSVLCDEERRKLLVEKGRKRLRCFSWEKCGKEFRALYRRVGELG